MDCTNASKATTTETILGHEIEELQGHTKQLHALVEQAVAMAGRLGVEVVGSEFPPRNTGSGHIGAIRGASADIAEIGQALASVLGAMSEAI